MNRPLSVLCLFLLTTTLIWADDDIVKEFKRYFKKYKDTATRVEAVLALEGPENQSPALVKALVPVLKDKEPEIVAAAVRVLSQVERPGSVAAVFEALDKQKNEAVRVGLLRAIAKGSIRGGEEILGECLGDKSWEVRRRAAKAIVAGGNPEVVVLLLPLCEDDEPAVRCAALDALAQLRSAEVLPPARELLNDDSWQVRSSAIAALGHVRHRDSIAPLIARLAIEEGRLTLEIGVSLGELTGKGFGRRLELWQRFWENYGEVFEIPTDEQMRKVREANAKSAQQYKAKDTTSYHGIETPSRSILFVIDVSGSMENLVVEKDRFEGGDYPSFKRIDIVKTELQRTIEGLEPYVKYNVIAFATGVKSWKKKLVKANVLNKSSAVDWVGKLDAIGGSSKEDLARAGLTGSANLSAGKTNTHGALTIALDAAGRGTKDKAYEVAVDTIFFLSDGRPSTGKFVDPDDILKDIREANDLRKVVIHTIAIGEFQKSFMQRLASENGGQFVDLGR